MTNSPPKVFLIEPQQQVPKRLIYADSKTEAKEYCGKVIANPINKSTNEGNIINSDLY